MGDPLLLPAIAVAAGILLGRLLGFCISEAIWPIAAFSILACGAASLNGKAAIQPLSGAASTNPVLTRLCIALACLFLGAFTEAWHRPGPPPQIDASSKETVILEGCVVEPTVFSATREQFTLELDQHARARASLNLRDGDPPQRLDYGQRVGIEARIRRPRNYNNPGSFDYAGYLARQEIFWTAAMPPGSRARTLPGRCGSRLMAMVFALRIAALERIEKLYGEDSYSTGMMEAILIGETSKLEKIWTQDFRRTGTFHALVISGIHVTVLAAVLLFLLRLCMIGEIPALAITAAAAWIYALVSGFSAPVVRAAGGFTLYLIARFFFRRGRVMNLLAAVALVYLLFDPAQLFDASFQLSFLCVAAIGALAAPLLESSSAPLARGTRDVSNADIDPHLAPRTAQFRVELRLAAETIALWTRIPRRWAISALSLGARFAFFCFEMAVISTVVQVGLALPMAEYFHRVSFTGVSANILIVPLLNCVVPLGFGAIFTGWRWLAWVAAALLKLAAKIAAWHASIEPAWRVPDPPLWVALAFIAALILLAMSWGADPLVRARSPDRASSLENGRSGDRPRTRGSAPRKLAIFAVLALFTLLLIHPSKPQITHGMLELTAIDVGQGDSLLVVFPEGKIMLIDGGGLLQYGRPRKTNLDTGEDVVSPYLWARGIRRIDVLVATHAHEDHSGGIDALIENFHPAEIWTGSNPLPRIVAHAGRIPLSEKRASPPFGFAGATVEVLSPPPDYRTSKAGNNDSLVMRIAYGSRSFLLAGDMERPMEVRLLDREIHADVLKVGHHGSKTSTMQPFLDQVAPSVAVISAGFENSFGHPNADVIDRLDARHSAILRTDLDGLVTVRTDGSHVTFDTMAWRESSGWWAGERSFNWAMTADR